MSEAARTVTPMKKPTTPAALKLVPPAEIFERMGKMYDSIARRAFEIFESNGRNLGHDLEHWFRAEAELLHPVHVTLTEEAEALAVKAEVPGFAANELEVSIEPRRLTISGKRETKEERKEKKTIYSETCSNEILRVVEFPVNVDATKASATLHNGVLELKVPKTAPATKISVEVKAPNLDPEC
jgi:HSP20 family protein